MDTFHAVEYLELFSSCRELHRYQDQLDVLENEIRSEEEIFEENYEAEVSAVIFFVVFGLITLKR